MHGASFLIEFLANVQCKREWNVCPNGRTYKLLIAQLASLHALFSVQLIHTYSWINFGVFELVGYSFYDFHFLETEVHLIWLSKRSACQVNMAKCWFSKFFGNSCVLADCKKDIIRPHLSGFIVIDSSLKSETQLIFVRVGILLMHFIKCIFVWLLH